MHDLHEADKILKLILKNAKANKFNKVTKAEIDLGQIIEHGAEILDENLHFNIIILAKGTIAEGLEININKIKATHWILKNIEGE
ncbi:MAG: hypothetical protein GF365_02640 [Candidatus Buchananbacteria bacterium]|nr:hypothetical protein [Candidatus Buchananbacteria bacterium]